MGSYGLSLLDGTRDGAVVVNSDTWFRFVARTFPGALPYVLRERGGGVVGHYETLEQATVACGAAAWDGVGFGVGCWESRAKPGQAYGGYFLGYGREDWPEPRVVLVGEVNPYRDRRAFDLYDELERSAGGRLRRLVFGVRRETYFRRFARHNLCVGKWSAPAARERAAGLAVEYPTETLVLLGRRVQEAFGLRSQPPIWYGRCSIGGEPLEHVVCLPHPSGLCLAWNEPGAFDRAREALLGACPELPLGEVSRG